MLPSGHKTNSITTIPPYGSATFALTLLLTPDSGGGVRGYKSPPPARGSWMKTQKRRTQEDAYRIKIRTFPSCLRLKLCLRGALFYSRCLGLNVFLVFVWIVEFFFFKYIPDASTCAHSEKFWPWRVSISVSSCWLYLSWCPWSVSQT